MGRTSTMGRVENCNSSCCEYAEVRHIWLIPDDCSQLWKNPVTGNLHLEVAPCGAAELFIDPLPAGAKREGALYPDGAHIKDLKETRELLYKMQRPGIAPHVRTSAARPSALY